jgi:flagellar biosynthetic protein FliR
MLPYLLPLLTTFVLVLTRLSGLLTTAPIYGTNDLPMRVRAFLAIALALLITPLQLSARPAGITNLVDLAIGMTAELVIGATLGLGIVFLLGGMQIAGQIIAQLAGIQLGDVINPTLDASVPVFSQMFFYVTLAVFVLIGGHRQVMGALLETFAVLPPGMATLANPLETFVDLLGQSFALGVRAAAPTMCAVLLATMVLGLLSRTLPQLNLMAVGFGLSSLVSLATLSVSLGLAAWAFQEQVDYALEALVDTIVSGQPSLAIHGDE